MTADRTEPRKGWGRRRLGVLRQHLSPGHGAHLSSHFTSVGQPEGTSVGKDRDMGTSHHANRSNNVWSIRSRGSVLSIGSVGSILSIGSVGLGAVGRLGRVGAFGGVDRFGGVGGVVVVVGVPGLRPLQPVALVGAVPTRPVSAPVRRPPLVGRRRPWWPDLAGPTATDKERPRRRTEPSVLVRAVTDSSPQVHLEVTWRWQDGAISQAMRRETWAGGQQGQMDPPARVRTCICPPCCAPK